MLFKAVDGQGQIDSALGHQVSKALVSNNGGFLYLWVESHCLWQEWLHPSEAVLTMYICIYSESNGIPVRLRAIFRSTEFHLKKRSPFFMMSTPSWLTILITQPMKRDSYYEDIAFLCDWSWCVTATEMQIMSFASSPQEKLQPKRQNTINKGDSHARWVWFFEGS
jgi:hypothetical protein